MFLVLGGISAVFKLDSADLRSQPKPPRWCAKRCMETLEIKVCACPILKFSKNVNFISDSTVYYIYSLCDIECSMLNMRLEW